MAKDDTSALIDQVQPIVRGAERLATLHTDLLRSELRQTAAAVSPALSSIGAGIGLASAGGILAVVLANIVAFFLVRMLSKNLKGEYES